MADAFALWLAGVDDEDIPDDEAAFGLFTGWLAADLAEQAVDRGLDPVDVAAALGEAEWRDACQAAGFAPVALRGLVA